MLNYDLIVIGFGKAGKTLAAKMNAAGKKVAVIERSKAMYGGTCINIACIPTKTMIVAAEKGWSFDDTMKEFARGILRPCTFVVCVACKGVWWMPWQPFSCYRSGITTETYCHSCRITAQIP